MVLRISVALLAVVALVLLFVGTGNGGAVGEQSAVRDLLGLQGNGAEVAALDDLGNPLPLLAGAGCTTAPGRSALDQYCQSIPDGTGGQSAEAPGGGGLTVAQAAPRATTSRLTDAGRDGDVLAGLPAAAGSDEEEGRDDLVAPPVTVPSATRRLAIAGAGGEEHLNSGLLIALTVVAAGLLGSVARVRRGG